jgi:hypothetical protein
MSRDHLHGRRRVDELIRRHLRRSGTEHADLTDPLTHLTTGVLRDILRLVDAALDDEQIDPAIARRILERIIYGAVPLPSHVEERKRLERLAIDFAAQASPTWAGKVEP